MELLSVPLQILVYCGVFVPKNSSPRMRLAFRIYRCFIATYLSTFVVLEGLRLGQAKSFEEFSDIFLVYATYAATLFKMSSLVINEREIFQLVEHLKTGAVVPIDQEERITQASYEHSNRVLTKCFNLSCNSCGIFFLVVPIILTDGHRGQELPLKLWLPFKLSGWWYWIGFAYELLVVTWMSSILATNDCIFSGLLFHACGQFKILGKRYIKICEDSARACWARQDQEDIGRKECVLLKLYAMQHESIYRYVGRIATTFSTLIMAQFFISGIIICTSILRLSLSREQFSKLFLSFTYFNCALAQCFIYCYSGSSVSGQSDEFFRTLYKMDWMALKGPSRKILLFTMFRSSHKVVIVGAKLMVLSLDSFKTILKFSYSTFNMLRSVY